MPDRGTRRPRKGGMTLAEPGDGTGNPPVRTGGDSH